VRFGRFDIPVLRGNDGSTPYRDREEVSRMRKIVESYGRIRKPRPA
jgi:hypothetical protein